MNSKVILSNLQRFADEHGLTLVERGECGFGRPCVGLTRNDNYIAFNPRDDNLQDIWPDDGRLYPPEGVDNYHKHMCLAVLVHNDDYNEGLRQLNKWIVHLESQGKPFIDTYPLPIHSAERFNSPVGYAIRLK
jgi:hypothetical protein